MTANLGIARRKVRSRVVLALALVLAMVAAGRHLASAGYPPFRVNRTTASQPEYAPLQVSVSTPKTDGTARLLVRNVGTGTVTAWTVRLCSARGNRCLIVTSDGYRRVAYDNAGLSVQPGGLGYGPPVPAGAIREDVVQVPEAMAADGLEVSPVVAILDDGSYIGDAESASQIFRVRDRDIEDYDFWLETATHPLGAVSPNTARSRIQNAVQATRAKTAFDLPLHHAGRSLFVRRLSKNEERLIDLNSNRLRTAMRVLTECKREASRRSGH